MERMHGHDPKRVGNGGDFVSIGVAYAGVRGAEPRRWHAAAADAAFVLGLVALTGSLTIAMFSF